MPLRQQRYLDRISGPLLDRIDIQVEVDAVPVEELSAPAEGESSVSVRERVVAARARQLKRFEGTGIRSNAQMEGKHIEQLANISKDAMALLHRAMQQRNLSMRAYGRIIKVARTIADLAGEEAVGVSAMAEAIQYRMIDSKYWGDSHD